MVLPNFLIVGAAKAGTTSLCYYLNQHPEVYISRIKEPRFFAPEFYTKFRYGPLRGKARKKVWSLEEYSKLFAHVRHEKAIGEASTEYLYFPEVPKRIKELIPQAKIIVVLRNPIERAFSAYCYQVRDGCESLSFEDALLNEKQRLREYWRPGWLYKSCGFYYTQLKRYFDIFERSQIKVYLYNHLSTEPVELLQDVYTFLGVSNRFTPDLSRQNVSKIPRSTLINRLFVRDNPVKGMATNVLPKKLTQVLASRFKELNLADKPELLLETRSYLTEIYREDILKLEALIDEDLSGWLKQSMILNCSIRKKSLK